MVETENSEMIRHEIRMDQAELELRSLKIKRWLRTNEAALYLGKSQGAIRNHVLRRQLRAKKFLGRNYFDRAELDELIESSSPEEIRDRRFKKWR